MALLEYANLTVPKYLAKRIHSFELRDPLIKQVTTNKETRVGGTTVRVLRIKGRHSDAVQLSGSNLRVPTQYVETYDYAEFNWARIAFPLILNHIDRDRLSDASEVKRWMTGISDAAMGYHKQQLLKRIYTGAVTNNAYLAIGSLNGANTAGTSTGLANGALTFTTPAAQDTAAATYLGITRNVDSTYETDNWYGQYTAHTGLGTNFLRACRTVKVTADDFCSDDSDGIRLGFLSLSNFISMNEEMLTYPGAGGVSAISYTVDDIQKGRAHPMVLVASGIHFHANRLITDARFGVTGGCLLINPDSVMYTINKRLDHQMTPFVDRMRNGMGEAADVAFVQLEVQSLIENLLWNGTVSQ